MPEPTQKTIRRRDYQVAALRGMAEHRSFFLLWRRQGGKSTTLAEGALREMMRFAGRLVTYASASLLLGREMVMKESAVLQSAIRAFSAQAAQSNLQVETVDRASHTSHASHTSQLSSDDFTEIFEAQRLEFRLWHDRTTCSRTQIIAPNPATARGWSGTVMLDEFGFIRDFRDLWEAVEPIISSDPDFRFIGATTPPKDDAHYSYELTAPPVGLEFPVDPAGNWYESDAGERVHRVDIHDAYAAGQKLYDRRTGAELTPEEHFRRAEDKDAWRRNYAVQHVLGGTSAVGLLVLDTAMRRGIGQCHYRQIERDSDLDDALRVLLTMLTHGQVGIGVDPATTTKGTSNPTSVSVIEKLGVENFARLIVTWKTADPALARERFRRIVHAVHNRPQGGPARRLAIDSSNERYFAADVRRDLSDLIPVEPVVMSESHQQPGVDPGNMKQWLGSLLVGELEDNHVILPPERYIREDFRNVKRDRGTFVCEPDAQGRHGDTFDSTKLGLHALTVQDPGTMHVYAASKRNQLLAARRERTVEA